MRTRYPTPEDIGLRIAPHLRADWFRAGFAHALHGRQLTRAAHLRLSFREGFRAAKLYLRELRRRQGVISFPCQGRIRIKAV